MLTPRRPGTTTIDVAAVLEASDWYQEQHCDGLAFLGTTGEFPHFDLEDRKRATSMLLKRSALPVLVNVSHSTLDGAVDLALHAADAGAAGLLLTPPIYFRYRQPEIREFYLRFRDRVPLARVLIYNMPWFVSEVKVETSLDLLATGCFAGIKDSSGDWDSFCAIRDLAATHPFSLMIGHDGLYAKARVAGASGAISGVAAALPDFMVALDHAIVRHHVDRAEHLHSRLEEFLSKAAAFPVPYAIREAACARGLKVGEPAAPLDPAQAKQLAEFRQWFRAWNTESL
jgi:dihydrodipicolinate synthase/N-acetylneuraminate lyase